jgi:hypothetical protein
MEGRVEKAQDCRDEDRSESQHCQLLITGSDQQAREQDKTQ